MVAALLALFTGPFGKYISYGILIVSLLGGAYGYLKLKEHDAVEAATAAYNLQQYQEAQKENTAYQEQLKDLQAYSTTQAQTIDKLTADLETATTNANKVVDKMKGSDKIPLDPLFNAVLNQLNGVK